MNLKRSELYKKVWTSPVIRVAHELGMADRSLLALCQRHRIPTPPRGFWRKIESGLQVSPAALPEPNDDTDIAIKPARGAPRRPASNLPRKSYGSRASRESCETVRRSTSPAPAAPSVPLLDPSNPLAFVKALGGDEAASQFVAMVERSARDCESPTKAVAFAWVYLARNAILHSARIGEVLDCCAQIASGESQAEWWDAIRSTEAA